MTQPEALYLADILEDGGKPADIAEKAALELRRLHAENEGLKQIVEDFPPVEAELSEVSDRAHRLELQRDALLEALKTVEWHGGGSCWVVDADKIAAAIKAAEEENT